MGHTRELESVTWQRQWSTLHLAFTVPNFGPRSVIFVYLNSCKRFDVNLPPETLQDRGLTLA